MELSIVIPVFNEEKNLPSLYTRLKQALEAIPGQHELIFVNDGSSDGSLQHIRQLADSDKSVKYIDFSRNFGHQVAVSAGIDHCTGEAVVIIDADLQDPPELIPSLWHKMKEGYEVVYARRKKRAGEGAMKKLTAKLFYRSLARITNIDIPLDTGDFRIMSRKIVQVLQQMPEQHKFLRAQIAWAGFAQTSIEYDRDPRNAGASGYTYRKMIRLALDGITGFSNLPLKMATIAGFLVSGITFLVSLYALYSRFVSKDYVPGWTSLILAVLFIGGVQLISIGIIGEYISRISTNVRKRPLYVIQEKNTDASSE
jgi:dolichol-phosphate mannosyltransferase